jgi:hypothetical protein
LDSLFLVIPTPCRDVPDNRLSVVAHVTVLNCDLLLSASAVLLERFNLRGEGSRQLI